MRDAGWGQKNDSHWARSTTAAVAVFALGLSIWGYVRTARPAARAYAHWPAESFTGAHLHLSPWQSSALSTVTANARWHGDMLFSLPGLFSFNLWARLPTPTLANITQWWALLDEPRQAAIATHLAAAARPVLIIQRNLITSGFHKGNYHTSLLARSLDENFVQLFSLDSYEFWVRRDSRAHPLGIAHWQPGESRTFSFYSAHTNLAEIRQVEFRRYTPDGDESVAPPAEVQLTSEPPTPDHLTSWTCRVTTPPVFSAPCDVARFYDAAATLITEVRFPRPLPQDNPQ